MCFYADGILRLAYPYHPAHLVQLAFLCHLPHRLNRRMHRHLRHLYRILRQLLMLLAAFRDIRMPPLEGISHVIVVLRQTRSIGHRIGNQRAIRLVEVHLTPIRCQLARNFCSLVWLRRRTLVG